MPNISCVQQKKFASLQTAVNNHESDWHMLLDSGKINPIDAN